MKAVLTRSALALFATCLLSTPALANPSSRSTHAGVIMPVPDITRDTARPQPILWDRVERTSIERDAKARKRVSPPAPAESTDRPKER